MENKKKTKRENISSALMWKFLERFGVQCTQFVLQIILARILDPEHYGVLSMMIIFTSLANVFIQSGFNTALIQNKDVTEEDYSSVFWITMGAAAVLYGTLFLAAPVIADFYNMPDLLVPFRVLCLILFPGALNSIQVAKISRALDFKKVFRSNVAAIVISGLAGIVMAYLGAGLWALVVQNLLNVSVACAVMWFTVKWRPHWGCNLARIRVLFDFGWKMLVARFMDTIYQDLCSLVIGKKYESGTLGYYNRGKQFPQFIINAINTAVQSVLLPVMAEKQDDRSAVKAMMRTSITISSYIIFPMMAGLAGVAEPLVRILLTDKWVPCVPYMQICCIAFALYPVHSCNLQAINAIGRSDIFLKLELIKKAIGIVAIVVAVAWFDSPIAIAVTGMIADLVCSFVNAYPNKKLVGYSYGDQMRDILPPVLLSAVMLAGVMAITLLQLNDVVTILLQVLSGVMIYFALSVVFKPAPFKMLLESMHIVSKHVKK